MRTNFFRNREAIVKGVLAEMSIAVFLMVTALLICLILSLWFELL